MFKFVTAIRARRKKIARIVAGFVKLCFRGHYMRETQNRIKKTDGRTWMLEDILIHTGFHQNIRRKNSEEKIKIVFLYVIDSIWASWKSLYEACLADEKFDVKLVFLDMEDFSNKTSQHKNSKKFLEENNISYINYKDYCVEVERPHVVVYQTPHQWYYGNFKEFLIANIKSIGIRTVYISYGIEYDTTIKSNYLHRTQFGNPIQQHAWRVFVMHEDIRKDYFLHCRRGGTHVRAFGHPKFDTYARPSSAFPQDIIKKSAGRKIVTYQVHLPNNNDCSIGKLHTLSLVQTSDNIKYLQSRDDVFVIVTIHPLYETYMLKMRLGNIEQLNKLKDKITEANNTYLYEGQHQLLIKNSDAFITENSSLMIEMAFFDKPVLYLYDIPVAMRAFAQQIVDTFYHGKNESDIESFINDVVCGNDIYYEKRKQVHNEIFANYDGNIGERIKEHIFNSIEKE